MSNSQAYTAEGATKAGCLISKDTSPPPTAFAVEVGLRGLRSWELDIRRILGATPHGRRGGHPEDYQTAVLCLSCLSDVASAKSGAESKGVLGVSAVSPR
jgi:hypothetical protein